MVYGWWMPGPNALPENLTRPQRLPAAEHVQRLRLLVSGGMCLSAMVGVGLMVAKVNPVMAAWVGLTGAATTGWISLELAARRIRSLGTALAKHEAADRETLRPVDRLERLEFRFSSRLPDTIPLDRNEREELQLLRQARDAGWIGEHDGVRSGRDAVPRIGRLVESGRVR